MANPSPSDPPPFTYDPLPGPNFIRLIERQGTAPDGTLSFSLATHSLDDPATIYHCLSYTWGNPFAHGKHFRDHFESVNPQYEASNQVPIIINGRLLRIQKNLYDALTTVSEHVFANYLNHPEPIQGRTHLHYAAKNGHYDYAEIWIKHGANVNARDFNGRTALHYAAEKGHSECIRLLCNGGALRAAKDNDGTTPMDLAQAHNHENVVAVLEEFSERPDPEASSIPPTIDWAHNRIWADAICINQDDVDEKSAQVGIMDQIYSRASFVMAWLGPSDHHTEDGLKTLSTLMAHAKQFQDSQIEPYGGSKDKYTEAGIPFISRDEWVALASIFQRQWFRRAWIVQEAILPGILILHIGSKILSWPSLGVVSEAIRYNEAKLGTAGSSGFVLDNDIAVAVEWNMAEMYKWREHMTMTKGEDVDTAKAHEKAFVLNQLVACFWTFLASDPRDKIFSLYGLLNAFSSDRLNTDYRRSIESVYISATRHIIHETSNLEILSHCIYSQHRRDDLPGWVPDFSLAGVNPVPSIFAADKGLEFQPPKQGVDDTSPILQIRGLYVGKISQAGGRQDTGPSGMFLFDPSWLKLALSLRKPHQEGQERRNSSLSEVLWRTLCMNMSPGSMFDSEKFGSQAPDDYAHQFIGFMILFILAGADRKVLEKVEIKPKRDEITISRVPYDPFEEDMASVLDDLDALAEHDGDRCYTPCREEIISLWNNLKCTMVRITGAGDDGGPNDFYLPTEVIEGKSRCVGTGYVKTSSRLFQRCSGIGRAFSVVYGGRQLVTVDNEYLGMAPLPTQVGDEIWVLPGLRSPAVLRNAGAEKGHGKSVIDATGSLYGVTPRRRFVGACYVHGLMNGEAIPDGDPGLVDIEVE